MSFFYDVAGGAHPARMARMNSQSRSSQTRQALLDAARQLLIEQGYARLAETRVCERGGVSRGALRYHFPDGLLDLLPALLDELIGIEGGKIDAAGVFNPRERIYLALYGLAHAQGQTDSLAVLELWMAARGDERLAERLNPIMPLPTSASSALRRMRRLKPICWPGVYCCTVPACMCSAWITIAPD